ncbi:hypothetical protein WDU94_015538 [Cyamophila willieti]
MLGEDSKTKLQQISLSNDTVKNGIEKMSCDVEEQLIDKIKKAPYFALQCDETTDVSQYSQLLVFVRFFDSEKNVFIEEMLFMDTLETTARGIVVFEKVVSYFEKNNLEWEKLACCCTDGAPAMLWSQSGFAKLLKEKNGSIITSHCTLHRQALAMKTLPENFGEALKKAIKLVNTVKSSALNNRIFKKLCTDLNAEHEAIPGRSRCIFTFEDKIQAFICKIDLWLSKLRNHNFSAFPSLEKSMDQLDDPPSDEIENECITHLEKLKSEFVRYFPEYSALRWVSRRKGWMVLAVVSHPG